ncbi:hypothetical protein SlGVgp006 [Spodoptera litura granulovirus]|uniref:Uncharacterized protein n=1 Tax=Spodoptera litura granulovirus TaxID=359919 RepID=A5IZK8_9BBAC|nr:hypothetical protein SlGVgp006 [Spodoptera litura granulovirus]ABQ51949.1 hypothetical protein SlGVgp006 [Spodoptera litura granulovirus]
MIPDFLNPNEQEEWNRLQDLFYYVCKIEDIDEDLFCMVCVFFENLESMINESNKTIVLETMKNLLEPIKDRDVQFVE